MRRRASNIIEKSRLKQREDTARNLRHGRPQKNDQDAGQAPHLHPTDAVGKTVFNEAAQLAESVGGLGAFLQGQAGFTWELVVADSGSTDRTAEIAEELVRLSRNLVRDRRDAGSRS